MSRFFVDRENISETEVTILGDDVKHISKVLRLRVGDEILVSDKCKTDYTCTVSEISQGEIKAKICAKSENTAEPPVYITLYQGLPKSDKMDYIVQKCVELGVSEITPVITKRVVGVPHDSEKKILRWQRIAEEAAKQCGRGIVPVINAPIDFKSAISEMCGNEALNLMPYECESEGKLKDTLTSFNGKNINVLIGPEGGFEESEVTLARESGTSTVTLGPRILRTETAPLAVISAIMYACGDW